MSMLTEKELEKKYLDFHEGIIRSYIDPIKWDERPEKEMLEHAKTDLEKILSGINPEETSPSILRLKKYREILEILDQIPFEDLLREKRFTTCLSQLGHSYFLYLYYSREYSYLTSKYNLISEKAKLTKRIEMADISEVGVAPNKKLFELAEKYIELVEIE